MDLQTLELVNATKKLIESLDPVVDVYESLLDLIHLKDPYKSTLFLLVASLCILHIEAAIALSLLSIFLFIQYNAYYRRIYEPHSITYVRNAQFLHLIMDLLTQTAEIVETFARNVLYWGQPAQSVLMMNVSLFGCVITYLSLKFMPLRFFCVVGLWIAALKNSEFFNTLGISVLSRLSRVNWAELKARSMSRLSYALTVALQKLQTFVDLMICIYEWPVKPILRFLRSALTGLEKIV